MQKMAEKRIVQAMVCAPGWVELTSADASWWAIEMVNKPVLYMGRESGIVKETWVKDGGVMANIEIDPEVWDAAWDRTVKSAIG